MSILFLAIHTIPDLEGGSQVYGLGGLNEKGVVNALFNLRRQETGVESLNQHLRRIVAVSAVSCTADFGECEIWSFGGEDPTEEQLVSELLQWIEERQPEIVTWDGNRLELPVLHYRAFVHGIGSSLWLSGLQHTSLLKALSLDCVDAEAPMNQLVRLLGFAGEEQLDQAEVRQAFAEERIADIRQAGQYESANLYVLYLRYQLAGAVITREEYLNGLEQLSSCIKSNKLEHLLDFTRLS